MPWNRKLKIVMPNAAKIIQARIPKKPAITDPLLISFSSSSLPAKTQNVMKPKMGIKNDAMYTNHLTQPMFYLLSILHYPLF